MTSQRRALEQEHRGGVNNFIKDRITIPIFHFCENEHKHTGISQCFYRYLRLQTLFGFTCISRNHEAIAHHDVHDAPPAADCGLGAGHTSRATRGLMPVISDFLTSKRWTIEQACERHDLPLLQRLIACEASNTHPRI